MGSIGTEFARQIILVIFYLFIIIMAIRLGIMMRKKKNEKDRADSKE